MFKVIPLCNGDRIIKNYVAFTPMFYGVVAGLVVPADKGSVKFGSKPVTGPAGHFNDKACDHFNVTGTAYACSEGLITTVHTKVRGSTEIPAPGYGDYTQPVYNIKYSKTGSAIFKQLFVIGQTSEVRYPDYAVIDSQGGLKEIQECTVRAYPLSDNLMIVRCDSRYRFKRPGSSNWDPWTYSCFAAKYDLTTINGKVSAKCSYGSSASKIQGTDVYSLITFSRPRSAGYIDIIRTDLEEKALSPGYRNFNFDSWIRLFKDLPPIDRFMWGDLAQSAADNAKVLDINSALYIRDLFKVKEIVSTLLALIRKPNPKNIANATLAYQYGVKLSVLDTLTIRDALKRIESEISSQTDFCKCRSMAHEVSSFRLLTQPYSVVSTYVYKIYYNPRDEAWLNTVRRLMNWDFFPTLQNVWDFIPFSFVVDWLLDIESNLEHQDLTTYLSTLKVLGVTKSRKMSISSIDISVLPTPLSGYQLTGLVNIDFYNRSLSSQCDLPLDRFDVPTSFNNWVEASALLVSLKSK